MNKKEQLLDSIKFAKSTIKEYQDIILNYKNELAEIESEFKDGDLVYSRGMKYLFTRARYDGLLLSYFGFKIKKDGTPGKRETWIHFQGSVILYSEIMEDEAN